jgi:peptidoglycan-N-acetylglucosamine deacetylase
MNILTFDIEEWFHSDFASGEETWDKYEVRIYKNVDRILNALDHRNQKATFFCLGWIAFKHPK